MEFRRLGQSGLVISEIAYGNWITHGAQIDEEAAHACVRAALDAGITTFDTADVYSETRAETVLGKALAGQRREGLVLSTKVCHPVGPGPNDRGLSRKHVIEGCEGSLRRLGTDYVDLYYAHRYDPAVPLEETMLAFADLVRSGKVLYVGVSEWTPEQISRAAGLARELRVPLVASQPQYSMLWRVIESQVVPACEREGLGQVVWSPLAQGILSGKYLPGTAAPSDSRAGTEAGKGFVDMLVGHWMKDEGAPAGLPGAGPGRLGPRPDDEPARDRVGPPEPVRLGGHHRREPSRAGQGERRGLRRTAGAGRAGPHRRDPLGVHRARPREDGLNTASAAGNEKGAGRTRRGAARLERHGSRGRNGRHRRPGRLGHQRHGRHTWHGRRNRHPPAT
ncbi:putative voltage-gated potassium channel subunit beta [Streptomyces afghaniensis 772]|uniref:Putative voltage-gated potassium channel subunit beta n=1 Tax=Streptomyces afghaniensis 772 TaxID=1283301 RepID=S4NC92_9ACTN|nr:putative voltage-gated potassium channel subunit beta [Streptomyces afghaniensis 772]